MLKYINSVGFSVVGKSFGFVDIECKNISMSADIKGLKLSNN